MKPDASVNLVLTFSLTLAFFLAVGCKQKADSVAASSPNSATNQTGPSNLHLVTGTEEQERGKLKFDVRRLTLNGDFQGLESMAGEFRSQKSRFRNGDWKLRAFYEAFGDYQNIGGEKPYQDLIAQLEHWAAERPDSITPRLALVEAYHGYAWVARGTGWASQVTEEGARLMQERMAKGFSWLGEAERLQAGKPDPAFHATALHICLGANVSRSGYEKVFAAGVKSAPDYTALYEYKAYYLLPRWYGDAGEWEAFARKTSERKDIPDSEELFARIALYLRDRGCFYDEFSDDDQAWEELKSSFHALETKYPDALEIKSILCLISIKLRDYKEGRLQMKSLNGQVDLGVWDTKANFLTAVRWLNRDDASLERDRQQFKTRPHRAD